MEGEEITSRMKIWTTITLICKLQQVGCRDV
uniref:Uncharacterized protein n=1 Tax=Arundo donax TaxID=35708 RepID=A0A0A8XQ70_ARUDO